MRLTFLEKKFRFPIGNIDLFAYSFFKNIEISSGHRVVQIKPNLVWSIPCVCGVYVKNFCYCLSTKKVSCSFRNLLLIQISNLIIGLFYRIKELFKVNQIDIPGYQYYLGCNAKRLVRLTFLEKSSLFNRKYRLIRLFYFQKY